MDIRYIAYPTASEISLQNYFRDWKEFKNRATRLDILNPYFDCSWENSRSPLNRYELTLESEDFVN